jgi:hypothetical protein
VTRGNPEVATVCILVGSNPGVTKGRERNFVLDFSNYAFPRILLADYILISCSY